MDWYREYPVGKGGISIAVDVHPLPLLWGYRLLFPLQLDTYRSVCLYEVKGTTNHQLATGLVPFFLQTHSTSSALGTYPHLYLPLRVENQVWKVRGCAPT
jgi:hypothetical protein